MSTEMTCIAASGRTCYCEPCRVGMAGASQAKVNQAYVQAVAGLLGCQVTLIGRRPLRPGRGAARGLVGFERLPKTPTPGLIETSTLVFGVPAAKVDQARRLGLEVKAVAALSCHGPIVSPTPPAVLRDNHRQIHGESSRESRRCL